MNIVSRSGRTEGEKRQRRDSGSIPKLPIREAIAGARDSTSTTNNNTKNNIEGTPQLNQHRKSNTYSRSTKS